MKETTASDRLLRRVRRIHMVGIGGAGMAPLAEILLTRGYRITGSDNNESDTLDRMRALGIPVTMGHLPENVGDAELVVHTAALLPGNPELEAAKARGIPVLERSLLLGALTREYDRVFGVCGTHGKTTVCSMLTHILIKCGKDPSAVIGGRLPLVNANGVAGKSDILVCEACEYVNTFLKLSPNYAVLLNIDNDHLEYFKTMENLTASFRKFCASADRGLVINGDDPLSVQAAAGIDLPTLTFGFDPGRDRRAENPEIRRGRIRFDYVSKDGRRVPVSVGVPGRHNILNATAALAAAEFAGVAPEDAARALEDFTGAGRRFERLGEADGVTVMDDYAHHPAELRATLTAANEMGFRRVVAIFQPFTYSRTRMLLDEFAEVLQIPDKVILSEIMGAREINTWNVSSDELAAKIPGAVRLSTFEEIADYAAGMAEPGDLFLTLGCGDIYKAAKILLRKLRERQAAG